MSGEREAVNTVPHWCGRDSPAGGLRRQQKGIHACRSTKHNYCIYTFRCIWDDNLKFTFTFIHLADALIQSDLDCIQVTHEHFIRSWTHDLGVALLFELQEIMLFQSILNLKTSMSHYLCLHNCILNRQLLISLCW